MPTGGNQVSVTSEQLLEFVTKRSTRKIKLDKDGDETIYPVELEGAPLADAIQHIAALASAELTAALNREHMELHRPKPMGTIHGLPGGNGGAAN